MDILFAPMQGYTDARFRQKHHALMGGVKAYYAPFARWERGRLRDKERRDLLPERNRNVPTVPQVIAKDRDELARLCDSLQRMGWDRIDLNMGCPFPMQYNSGRGSGLLPRPETVSTMLEEMRQRHDVAFSVKMRLGLTDREESMRLLPMLNDAPLVLVTMHPRLGMQQYRGTVDREGFEAFYEGCSRPLAYNGDIKSVDDIARIAKRYPRIAAVMIGRGLIEHPRLAMEWAAIQQQRRQAPAGSQTTG